MDWKILLQITNPTKYSKSNYSREFSKYIVKHNETSKQNSSIAVYKGLSLNMSKKEMKMQ